MKAQSRVGEKILISVPFISKIEEGTMHPASALFCHVRRIARGIMLVALLLPAWFIGQARAGNADLAMQSFTQRDGVDSSYIYGLAQDKQGYLYLLTQRALYFFSGRRFYRIHVQDGPGQPSHADGVRFLPDGRVLVLKRGTLAISQRQTTERVSPLLLQFRRVELGHVGLVSNILIDHGRLVVVGGHGVYLCDAPRDDRLSCPAQPLVANPRTLIYQIGEAVFLREPGSVVLHDLSGLRVIKLPWDAEISDSPFTQSDSSFYALQTDNLLLPHQNGHIEKVPVDWAVDRQSIVEHPTFAVETGDATVFFDGTRLRYFNGQYWNVLNHALGREQDIHFAYIDRDRQLWTVQDSVELTKLIGWSTWENLEPESIRSVWSVLPLADEKLLLTDHGLYEFRHNEIGERLRDGNFFFGLPDGKSGYWLPVDDRDLLHCLFQAEHLICNQKLPIRRILGLVASIRDDKLWIASDEGLLEVPQNAVAAPDIAVDEAGRPLNRSASAITLRDDGTPWAIIGNALYRRTDTGRWSPVLTHWANGRDFSPLTMIFTSHDDLWVGGLRARAGLVHIHLDGNRIGNTRQIGAQCTGSQIIFSLLWDHHKRLWVGTENGLAVFDGRQWLRLTRDDGLISANINQQGLTEDTDGSIWVTTTRGVSHLMHPDHFFEPTDLKPVFIEARLGEQVLPEHAVPFTRDPLVVTLGTLNTALASTTYFRYRLEGVDQDWITSTTGEIRYNFVPPGHSRLIVQAINDNRNIVSRPIVLLIRMQRPWWMAWPLIVLYIAAVVILPYVLNRVRFRYLLKRQRRLEALVNERTVEMRAAQAALEQQARQDGLTRLMNRRTAEASVLRLLERLGQPDFEGEHRSLTLALFDVDYFKSINDTFGHTIGDEILAEIGARLLRDKQPEEIIGRYGGEEFLIVIQGDMPTSFRRVEALLAGLSNEPFETKVGALAIGCSAGLARSVPEIETPREIWMEALERADQALYRAKLEGRGRLVVSEQDQDDEDYQD